MTKSSESPAISCFIKFGVTDGRAREQPFRRMKARLVSTEELWAMVPESDSKSEAVDSMAETVKVVVQDTANWIRKIRSLPIEEAEAEYAQSAVEGDSILKNLQQAQEQALENGVSFYDWAVSASHDLWGPFTKRPTAVGFLFVDILSMMTGFRFLNEIKRCDITDESNISALQYCAHSPDVRFLASCGFQTSRWSPEMSFRTGFEAARYFAEQCDYFNHRIQVADFQGPYSSEDCDRGKLSNGDGNGAFPPDPDYTFSEILELCKDDRESAQQCLFPCVCVEHLQIVIDYEMAWLKHAFCNRPEPRPWILEKEQWLTDRHPAPDSQHTATSNDHPVLRTADGLFGMIVVDTAEKITVTRFVKHLGRDCCCTLTEDNQKAVFRKLMDQKKGKIAQKEFLSLVRGRTQQNNTRDRLRRALATIHIRLLLADGHYALQAIE